MIQLSVPSPYARPEVALFDALVREGEERAHVTLPHQLHALLVGCLTEYLRDPSIVSEVLAINLMRALEEEGTYGGLLQKRIGDEALLLAGLFPARSKRLNVSPEYFRFMGASAYTSYAARLFSTGRIDSGRIYTYAAQYFALLAHVLAGTRV